MKQLLLKPGAHREAVSSNLEGMRGLISDKMNSLWDATRVLASDLRRQLPPPPGSGEAEDLKTAIAMAGSPRTRESDAGARLIVTLYESSADKGAVEKAVVNALLDRVAGMKAALGGITSAEDGRNLPLAHGLFLALSTILSSGKDPLPDVLPACHEALALSLEVVSDSDDPCGDDLHKGYAHADFESAHQLSAVTLNVNGGCLGTNTGFR